MKSSDSFLLKCLLKSYVYSKIIFSLSMCGFLGVCSVEFMHIRKGATTTFRVCYL